MTAGSPPAGGHPATDAQDASKDDGFEEAWSRWKRHVGRCQPGRTRIVEAWGREHVEDAR
jgi:hypothetical protein